MRNCDILSYLLIPQRVDYRLHPKNRFFVPAHYLLYLLLYIFDSRRVLMLIKAQNGLICVIAHLILTELWDHVGQNVIDGTFFSFEIAHGLNDHVLEIFAILTLFRREQKLIGITKSFKIFTQTLANLADKIIILQPIIFFDCVSDVLFGTFFFWKSLNGVHD